MGTQVERPSTSKSGCGLPPLAKVRDRGRIGNWSSPVEKNHHTSPPHTPHPTHSPSSHTTPYTLSLLTHHTYTLSLLTHHTLHTLPPSSHTTPYTLSPHTPHPTHSLSSHTTPYTLSLPPHTPHPTHYPSLLTHHTYTLSLPPHTPHPFPYVPSLPVSFGADVNVKMLEDRSRVRPFLFCPFSFF